MKLIRFDPLRIITGIAFHAVEEFKVHWSDLDEAMVIATFQRLTTNGWSYYCVDLQHPLRRDRVRESLIATARIGR